MGKRSLNRYRISLESNACIGCLACTRFKFFEAQEDGKARTVITEVEDLGCCQEVVDACPVGAIVISHISKSKRR
jgi:ferredoxin